MEYDKEQAKEEIKKLINDFKANYQDWKRASEADVETKLVEELFIKILGWTKDDFNKQAKARRGEKLGEADYAFHIEDKIVFYLEVKRVGIPLDKEADKQVVSYALSKRVPFAVSTNFGSLKIFCVEGEGEKERLFRAFTSPDAYLTEFQDLMFLSKESFEKGIISKKAEDEGRLRKRRSMDKFLLEDLMHIRMLIANDIEHKYPQKYELNQKDEIVQRIVNRLIFIRRSEDAGINPENYVLIEITHLPDNKAYPKLKEFFKKYSDVYDSGLFVIGKDNDCDDILIDGLIIKNLVKYLYESKNGEYIYNFDWIDADVLGQVYEQYLGKILEQKRSGKSKLVEGQAHRKEQGIYYTPTYVVDYIVKNTVGEALKSKKDPKEIKILDPACGSGSFLIKAFDYVYKGLAKDEESQQRRLDSQGHYSFKTQILMNNIYGVDLDNQAVEITKLNLLLKASEPNRKLPKEIDFHIRQGNSLIDDEAVAGLNAFKWDEKFKDVTLEGGFDVVIGNPPWLMAGYNITDEEIEFLHKNYDSALGKFDMYYCFIEKSLKLLSKKGILGMIVPNKFFHTKSAKGLRKVLLNSNKLYKVIDFGDEKIFGDATNYSSIILLKPRNEKKVTYVQMDKTLNIKKEVQIDSDALSDEGWYFEDKTEKSIFTKMESNGTPLKAITRRFGTGAQTGADKLYLVSEEQFKEFGENKAIFCRIFRGRDIRRYSISKITKIAIFPYKIENNEFMILNEDEIKKYSKVWQVLESNKGHLSKRVWFGKNATQLSGKWYGYMYLDKLDSFVSPHIVTPSLSDKSNFSIGTGDIFVTGTAGVTSVILDKIAEDMKYVLGLLNSSLISFYVIKHSPIFQGGYHKFSSNYLKKIPIRRIDFNNGSELEVHKKIVELVTRMLSLNNKLNEIGDKKTSETAKLQEQILNTGAEIDELVYKIYGLTDSEIKVVEQSLK